MKKIGKTAKVAGEKNVLSVKQETAPVKKFNAPNAETVESEIVEETKTEENTPQNPSLEPTETKDQSLITNESDKKKEPTLQEFKDRATILFLLQEKHSKLLEKKNRLEHFAISHDNQNAEIIIKDANGEEFRSSSPKTIGQFIAFCKDEFSSLISETESNLIKAFAV